MSNLTGGSGAQNVQTFTGGSGGCTQEAIPRIRLDGALSGHVVVADDTGQLFCINADHGTIRRLTWE